MTGKTTLLFSCSVGFLWVVAILLSLEQVKLLLSFSNPGTSLFSLSYLPNGPQDYFHIQVSLGSLLRSPKESIPSFSQSSSYDNKMMHIFKVNSSSFLNKFDSLKLIQTQAFLVFQIQKTLIFFSSLIQKDTVSFIN